MPTINQLPLRSPVSLGDQIPIYSPNNGDARRTPVSAVVDLVVSGLDLPNTAVLLTGNQTVGGVKTFTNPILGNITGNAGSVTNGVYTTGNQTIGGTKTFSSTIVGDISGNAGTVTNGVYTTGNQTIGGTKTFSSAIVGDISGNAGTVTNGVYTTGNQTIGGTKTFSSTIVGDISGNAATATTATTATTAGSVTNGVYTVGDQTIGGTKTFSVNPILSAGTVNAILTLDGSKQISAVSGLTWDSTKSNLSLGGVTVGQGNVPSLNNIAFGNSVLTTVTTGQSNVAIGASALRLLTGGNSNTAIGVNALRANTTGFSNIAIGSSALFANQTGGQNVAIGDSALQDSTVSGNVAIGVVALAYNTTGTFNTAVGTAALKLVATGSSNTAVGYDALRDFIGGSSNTAIGHQALIGAFPNSNSSSNTAVGAQAGQIITTGGSNTLVGQSAGSSISSAGNNTLIGQSAGSTISTGGSNTVIGRFDGNQNSLDIRTTSNNIVLSDGAGNPRSYYDGPNNAWIWRTGASERMRIDSSGNVAFSAGTAAAPALTTIGDLDTGVFFPAANTWAVATGGVQALAVDPSGGLSVRGAGTFGSTTVAGNTQINLASGTSDYTSFTRYSTGLGEIRHFGTAAFQLVTHNAADILFYANNSERMRITSAGNVGVGINTPAYLFDVANGFTRIGAFNTQAFPASENSRGGAAFGWNRSAGSAQVTITNVYDNAPLSFEFAQKTGASTANVLYAFGNSNHLWYTGGFERMRITSGGDVGIGTTGPTSGIELFNASGQTTAAITTGTNVGSFITLRHNSAAAGAGGGVIFGAQGGNFAAIKGLLSNGSNNTAGDLAFSTRRLSTDAALTECMRIDASGNVGIGTTSPLYPLDVRRAVAGGTAYISVDNTSSTATSLAGIYFSQNGTPKHSITAATFGADYLSFNVGAAGVITERMRIDSSGNVGIGDTSPSSRGRLSVLATTGAGRQFVVKTDGAAEVRYDDNGSPAALQLQNYGLTGANQGFALLWRLGDSLANANDAGSIDVISEGTWGATAASRDSAMRFQTTIDGNINERMRITSAGLVGIGTITPDALLTVNGVASFGAGSSALPSIARFGALDTGVWFPSTTTVAVSIGGGERFRVTSLGVRVSGGSVYLDDDNFTQWGTSDTASIIGKSGSGTTGYIKLSVNGEIMRIKSSGQVRLIPNSGTPAGAENGDLYYDSSTNKFRGYANGTWVDLH